MYPIKARNGSVLEPNKAPSVGLTLELLDRPFGLLKLTISDNSMKSRQSGMFGQRWSDPDKCCWIRTRRLNWSARQRFSEIRQDG
ncbi:hypothetical protein DY000_02022498 [Brassica cretica]|uniref:Uncharacterized protein n=1 Tax=Brassica cretica TaxID=69181 RepID=A0ABQ7EJ30_BRACR|nr:hypothetical protein DY000_02022498 [Brassica cretica]